VGLLAKDQQKNSMASFDFSFPAINVGTTFIFGLWVCIVDGSGGFSSHQIDPASTKTLRQEQLGETASTEILLPEIAEEIKSLSLSETTSTCFRLGLENSAVSYFAIFHQKNLAQNSVITRTAPQTQFDSYPDSDDDFDLDLLNFPSLTIMATPLLTVIKCQIRPSNRLIIKENYTPYSHICITNLAPQLFSSLYDFR